MEVEALQKQIEEMKERHEEDLMSDPQIVADKREIEERVNRYEKERIEHNRKCDIIIENCRLIAEISDVFQEIVKDCEEQIENFFAGRPCKFKDIKF